MTVCFTTNAAIPGTQNKVCRELLRLCTYRSTNNNFTTGVEELFHTHTQESSNNNLDSIIDEILLLSVPDCHSGDEQKTKLWMVESLLKLQL